MNGLTFFVLLQMGFLVVLDVLVPRFPKLGVVGLAYWGVLWTTLSLYALSSLIRVVRLILTRRLFVTAIASVSIIGLILISAHDPRHLSGETTREIGCIRSLLTQAPDRGFSGTCHLGYPARQFYLPAIPTILFGPSYSALQLGNIAYFIIGFIIFLHGLISSWHHAKDTDLKLGIVLSSLLHFYLAMYIILTFEQAVYPISLTLLAIGLWLEWHQHQRSILLLLLIGLIQLALIHLYTPALAVVALNMVLFAYFGIDAARNKSRRWILFLSLILLTGISLVISVMTRTDIRITTAASPPVTIPSLLEVAGNLWRHVVYRTGSIPWISTVYTLPFVLLIAASLAGLMGIPAGLLAVWIVSVMYIAVFSYGYASGSVDYKLQRAIIIIPFVLYLVAEALKRFHIPMNVLRLLMLILFVTGIGTYRDVLTRKTDLHQVVLAEYLNARLPQTIHDEWIGTIYLSDELRPYIKVDNFEDVSRYFLPGWHANMVTVPGSPCRYGEGVWVLPTTHGCAKHVRGTLDRHTVTTLGILTVPSIETPSASAAFVVYRVQNQESPTP